MIQPDSAQIGGNGTNEIRQVKRLQLRVVETDMKQMLLGRRHKMWIEFWDVYSSTFSFAISSNSLLRPLGLLSDIKFIT